MEEARGRGCLDSLSAALTLGPTYSGCSPLKRGASGSPPTPPIGGRSSPSPPTPTSVPPPYPRSPVTARRQAGQRGSMAEGTSPAPATPRLSASLTRRARLSPESAASRLHGPFPSSGRHGGPPWKQRHPWPRPRSPPPPSPPPHPLAFPSPLLRTRANCEAAPATSGALPGPPRQAPAARSVRWGFQARSSCGLWVRPEPAESTHHGVCARGGGGCPRGEARPKGPRRRRRQRNRTPAAA